MQVRLRAHRARGVGVHHAVGDDRALLRHHVPPQEAQPQALAHSLIRLGRRPLQPPEVLRIKVYDTNVIVSSQSYHTLPLNFS